MFLVLLLVLFVPCTYCSNPYTYIDKGQEYFNQNEHPGPDYYSYNKQYFLQKGNLNYDGSCECTCARRDTPDLTCSWELVFKAVAGNGRKVYDDFSKPGWIDSTVDKTDLNIEDENIYRDGHILDAWDKLDIREVKLELFTRNVRVLEMKFDNTASDINSWFSRDRVISSPYTNVKSNQILSFYINEEYSEGRTFLINGRYGNSCATDCSILMVSEYRDEQCSFDQVYSQPYFLYSTDLDDCQQHQNASVADRFVLSLKICDHHVEHNLGGLSMSHVSQLKYISRGEPPEASSEDTEEPVKL